MFLTCSRSAGTEGVRSHDMPNTRSRKLTVVLAAGALTMLGRAGACAAEEGPGGGGGGGGGGGANPLCNGTPLATTPFCMPGEKPPSHNQPGGGDHSSATPADESGPGEGGGGGGGG